MYPGLYSTPPLLDLSLLLTSSLAFVPFCSATPELTVYSNYFDPAPSPEDGPPFSAGALRNPAYLPAQIGGIVGAYALSLVVVAAVLLSLAKTRRKRLTAGEAGLDNHQEYGYQFAFPPDTKPIDNPQNYPYPYPPQTPKSPIQNFSYPTPSAEQGQTPYTFSGSFSTYSTSTLGINLRVDQRVVAADREMAQQQLEEMYKYVLEQEAAKEAGTPIERPPTPLAKQYPSPIAASPKPSILKRSKNKPAHLDLEHGEPEKQSRASSILSALKSPRKKKSMKAISISSPIMTPMSGTFPRQDGEEMNVIPPRQYAPASPPPIPTDRPQYLQNGRHTGPVAPITPPDLSPESTQSIDERIGSQFGHSRFDSQAPTEVDPVSAASERSTAPLIGLPSSPKPNVTRFPSLPSSPKPGATFPTSPRPGQSFSRPNAPSAVRTGGALPLRAYEPALSSPSAQTTKQTTFERTIPLSPGARTPWTGAPVPYTPYQPFSPVVPVTPSLVTKADRKRMKQLQPKTPTMHMVQSSDDMW